MNDLLKRSREIVNQAIADYQPYAIVIMFSGGDDSLTAYHLAKALEVPATHFLHGVTGTGIPQTTEFARRIGKESGLCYIEANAGKTYEKYIWRKGFFGVGDAAHLLAYHELKNHHFEKALSRHIRKGQRERPILLINGARWQESRNRERMKEQPVKLARKNRPNYNIWVNIINDWTRLDCTEFLADYQRNPVTELLHRSGECMCGTMQSQEQRKEAAFWFPEWGRWLDELETAVKDKHGWGWGESIPTWFSQAKAGQLFLDGFMPMCHKCEYGR
jgi:3'-phosphoadenosine 5'-phosphosulfate sulfotransferase (PAPS reductase)/FAD synthetase